jgi:phage FluMu protein gp41
LNAYELANQVEMWGEDLLALNMKGGIPVIEGAKLIRQQADRIADLETTLAFKKMKPLSDEEVYKLWCEADNTELLPEMRLKDGSINYIITTFAKLIEEKHGIK